MDPMIQLYYEESEEMLQKAEECMIRLEEEYSSVDINELFRIAHTIKGSSHMVGYADIGNLMHKIEDLLDCARNGSISFNQSIVTLCFEGLDTAQKMLLYKKESGSDQMIDSLTREARRIAELTEVFIGVNKKVTVVTEIPKTETGIISACLAKPSQGKNSFYISFFFEDDIAMVSPVLLMILNCVQELGSLVYSSVNDNYFNGHGSEPELAFYNIILSTDTEEAELYANFDVTYVESINIVNLSRSKLAINDYRLMAYDSQPNAILLKALIYLCRIGSSSKIGMSSEEMGQMKLAHDQAIKAIALIKNRAGLTEFLEEYKNLYLMAVENYETQKVEDQNLFSNFDKKITKLIEKGFNAIKGRYVVSVYQAEKIGFTTKLRHFIGKMNKAATFIFLVDLSQLTLLAEQEVKDLIEIKRQLADKDIELGIIACGLGTRAIVNIFDSIMTVEKFEVSQSGTAAILKILRADAFLKKISARTKYLN